MISVKDIFRMVSGRMDMGTFNCNIRYYHRKLISSRLSIRMDHLVAAGANDIYPTANDILVMIA